MDTRFISPRNAARRLGYTERTVRRLIAEGKLPAVRLGRTLRLELDALERILAANKLPLDPNRAFKGASEEGQS